MLRWEDPKREYAAFKRWKKGEIPFREAYRSSAILRRIIYRIIANESLPDDKAYGVSKLYPPYSTMEVVGRLKEEGLITLKRIPLSAGTTKIIARPTPKLLRLLSDDETGL